MKSRIHYTKPSITEREIDYANDAVSNGWGPRCYEYIARFEEAFKKYLGVKHAIATSSCTGAMHMGLSGLGVGPGDEVILADINWVATAAPITYLGATPVLVDVDPVSWCIDPARVEQAITAKTKAIIAVHLYGNVCDMRRLFDIGERHGIAVVEDAAEAIGSQYHEQKAGSNGVFGTFSFHGSKTVTTGEGGMFVTNNDALFEKVLTLSNHGRSAGQLKQFWPDMIGFKYKLSNVQAAIGLAQMERIEDLVADKRRVFEAYSSLLEGLPITMNPEPGDTINGYWMPTFIVDPLVKFDRNNFIAHLGMNGIDGRAFFWPLSDTGHFDRCLPSPVAHSLFSRGVNLPSYYDLSAGDIERVADCVRQFLGAN
ncbi:MAG TPA: DegT/DnrJ/EryC1/StrS aminotransferase family protein [Saprospiraceae bacterium]|nr:DegT/DnrJ/EryC1/StrS aminotransferase family protein [Saprospiraceae bacterium]